MKKSNHVEVAGPADGPPEVQSMATLAYERATRKKDLDGQTFIPGCEPIEAEVLPLPEVEPLRLEMWLVLAYSVAAREWIIPSTFARNRGLFPSRQAAVMAASRLSPVWKHKQIVHIPGNYHAAEVNQAVQP